MSETYIETSATAVQNFAEALFLQVGVKASIAQTVAEALTEAELQGAGTHGLLQAPVYLRRIMAGTISRRDDLRAEHQSQAVVVYDGGLVLGHAAADRVMGDLIGRTGRFGIAVSAVHTATHFGMAGRYARKAAEAGQVGIVMCNTRPMLPAPSGSAAVVGNNPLAIAVPCAGRDPIVLDMAMSATSMGSVRLAAATGRTLPEGLALDAQGHPTTDPAAAIRGLLLPAAGAKGFGLALMVDFLCALSRGKSGQEVRSAYVDVDWPADCSWLFLAIDPGHFGLSSDYPERVAQIARGLGGAALPGDRKIAAMARADGRVRLPTKLISELETLSAGIEGGDPVRLLIG